MSVSVTIENEADVGRLLQTLPSEVFSRLQQILANGTFRLAERAREFAPVKTGHLLASIYPNIGEMEDASEAFAPFQVVADTPYASFVEFGTSKMIARPFLGPAVEEIEPQVMEEIDSILADLGLPPEKGIEE